MGGGPAASSRPDAVGQDKEVAGEAQAHVPLQPGERAHRYVDPDRGWYPYDSGTFRRRVRTDGAASLGYDVEDARGGAMATEKGTAGAVHFVDDDGRERFCRDGPGHVFGRRPRRGGSLADGEEVECTIGRRRPRSIRDADQ